MDQYFCSIHRERCQHHPVLIALVIRPFVNQKVGTEQYWRLEVSSMLHAEVEAIEAMITGLNAPAH